jgi:DNA topoisomerase-3
VSFEFEQREGGKKYPPRKTAAKKTPFGKAATKTTAKAAKTPAAKKAAKTAAPKAPRKAAVGTLKPSAALMAVIGDGTYARTEVVKKIWDYIKANNLQDPADKRSIKADGKLKEVFGKDSATMFELAGIIGKHLS